jgi:hypothetical protein
MLCANELRSLGIKIKRYQQDAASWKFGTMVEVSLWKLIIVNNAMTFYSMGDISQ